MTTKNKYGSTLKLSKARKAIIDFMYFSKKNAAYAVAAEAVLQLETLVAAKRDAGKNISWYTLFIKAFALVSQKYPELRQSYFKFPWPHIFQYYKPSAMLAIERQIDAYPMVVFLKIDSPDLMPLNQIEQLIKTASRGKYDSVKSIQRFLKILNLPLFIRRLAWFLGLNTHSYKWRYFGTFGVTGLGRRVRSLNVKTPLPVTFIFDINHQSGPLFRVFWDHRIFDGVVLTKMIQDLERILNGPIAEELLLSGYEHETS